MMFSLKTPWVGIAAIVIGLFLEVASWVHPSSSFYRQRWFKSNRRISNLESRPSIFFEDEYECPDEDDCEIDWNSMPGFDDEGNDEEGKGIKAVSSDFEPECPDEEECEIDWSMMPGFDDEDEDAGDEKSVELKTLQTNPVISSIDSDPDCPDEEECEIDWSMMPGFGDDDNDSSDDALKKDTESFLNEEFEELEPQVPYVRQTERSVEKSRKHLQMNWQIDDCVADETMCTDFCSECAGSGMSFCKFCNGTGMILFGDKIRSCILCQDGRVSCKACAGTGKISPWAKTHDESY